MTDPSNQPVNAVGAIPIGLARIGLCLAILAAVSAAAAPRPEFDPAVATVRLACPPAIETRQSAAAMYSPFRSFTPTDIVKNHLARIALYDGHPSEQADLKPDNGDAPEPALWTLDPKPERPYWMVCEYLDTSVRMIRSLPPGLAACRVELQRENEPAGLACEKGR